MQRDEKLTHENLFKIMKNLGYDIDDSSVIKGICSGFTRMWVQAYLLDEEDKFFERLHRIVNTENLQGRIQTALIHGKEAYNLHIPLNDEDQAYIDILAFFDDVSLWQEPDSKTGQKVFEKLVTQKNIEEYADILQSKAMSDQLGLETLYSFPFIGNEKEIQEYLLELKKVIKKYLLNKDATDKDIVIRLGSTDHAIGLNYNQEKDCWQLIDTAYLQDMPKKDLDDQAIASAIMESLKEDDIERLKQKQD